MTTLPPAERKRLPQPPEPTHRLVRRPPGAMPAYGRTWRMMARFAICSLWSTTRAASRDGGTILLSGICTGRRINGWGRLAIGLMVCWEITLPGSRGRRRRCGDARRNTVCIRFGIVVSDRSRAEYFCGSLKYLECSIAWCLAGVFGIAGFGWLTPLACSKTMFARFSRER